MLGDFNLGVLSWVRHIARRFDVGVGSDDFRASRSAGSRLGNTSAVLTEVAFIHQSSQQSTDGTVACVGLTLGGGQISAGETHGKLDMQRISVILFEQNQPSDLWTIASGVFGDWLIGKSDNTIVDEESLRASWSNLDTQQAKDSPDIEMVVVNSHCKVALNKRSLAMLLRVLYQPARSDRPLAAVDLHPLRSVDTLHGVCGIDRTRGPLATSVFVEGEAVGLKLYVSALTNLTVPVLLHVQAIC
jgi:hypothetical protein